MVVLKIMADGKIFFRIALIRKTYKPPLVVHVRQNKTIELIQREYWLYGCHKDIKAYVRNYRKYGHIKTRHDKTP
jgi:hypothetical protein